MLDYPGLVAVLRKAFQADYQVPPRHHHAIDGADANLSTLPGGRKSGQVDHNNTLLLMPAWRRGKYLGVKIVTVAPGNEAHRLPTVQGVYLLFDAVRGSLLAQMDGPALTARRTAAASALASTYLSVNNSSTMLMIGTGVMARQLIEAHTAVRPIRQIFVWGRNFAKARQIAADLEGGSLVVSAVESIEEQVAAADIISCATTSKEPLLKGEWLRPGQHIDLVGSYLPDSREADDEVIRRARIFADHRQAACRESGDLYIPIQKGILAEAGVVADLFELCRREKEGRQSKQEITCFKSVGLALEDLAAAEMAYERLGE